MNSEVEAAVQAAPRTRMHGRKKCDGKGGRESGRRPRLGRHGGTEGAEGDGGSRRVEVANRGGGGAWAIAARARGGRGEAAAQIPLVRSQSWAKWRCGARRGHWWACARPIGSVCPYPRRHGPPASGNSPGPFPLPPLLR